MKYAIQYENGDYHRTPNGEVILLNTPEEAHQVKFEDIDPAFLGFWTVTEYED